MDTPTPEHDRSDSHAGGDGAHASHDLTRDGARSPSQPPRVMIVVSDLRTRRTLTTALRKHGFTCDPVSRTAEALGAVDGASYDVAIIGLRLREGSGNDLLRAMRERSPLTKIIMLGDNPLLDEAIVAMRLGAVDLLARPLDADEAVASVTSAAALSGRDRNLDRRMRKLQRLCHALADSRSTEATQVGALCQELETTSDELNDHVEALRFASEYRALIERELDIEALLRVSLEYILRKTGPTNAAVYLPSNQCDYSLGAYVNYDCPRESADMLLDHLADVLAPRFEGLEHVLLLESQEDLAEHLGDDASWLADSRVVVFACRHEDECLAVVIFFRDRDKPFGEDLLGQLEAIKDAFGQQLARVVRVHNRMTSAPDWLNADDADDFGLAA